MALEIVRRIRGNVHDSIDVSELENAMLRHPYVQRLRRIKQLAFLQYAFPGATHTRFEHVLGVMHLAGVAWDKLRVNQKRLALSCAKFDDFIGREFDQMPGGIIHGLLAPTFAVMDEVFRSDYVLQVIRLAGLLHDIGHPPFSHSGERFLPSWEQTHAANPDIPAYLHNYFATKIEQMTECGVNPSAQRIDHEVMSILMIERVISDTYREQRDLKMKVSARDVIAVLTPGITPAADSVLNKNNLFLLCRELISGELDIDRMDYLLRDSKECGVVYGIFDVGRILDSLNIYYNTLDCGFHIAISLGGLPAFEDYLRARHSMYQQLYFHKTSVAAEAMFEHLADLMGGWELPAGIAAYAEYDEYCIGRVLLDAVAAGVAPQRQEICRRLIRDLIYDRRLWKRVYEVSSRSIDTKHVKKLAVVKEYLAHKGYHYRHISSVESLTSFHPRAHNQPSQNYLRLIKKDDLRLSRVHPIEDYSSLINANDIVCIDRIYCESHWDAEHNRPLNEQIKLELVQLLASPGSFMAAPQASPTLA